MNEIRDMEKVVVNQMLENAAQSAIRVASHELNQTEFVRLTGEPWHGDSADIIQLQARVGNSIDGPFVYSDRPSRVMLMKRSEWVEPTIIDRLRSFRGSVSELGEGVATLRKIKLDMATPADTVGEFFANVTLAYRHLEDARMRLGKAIQALDGGVSCYDK